MPELLLQVFSNAWSVVLVVLFLGGSIFVHELGHFLAARWRKLHVDRFSIGFGPKIVSWNRGGVEYRISWLPLGGYVALPQLADMSEIEGESSADAEKLPPISYPDKIIVSVAGAVFNMLFALVLALIIWQVGLPTNDQQETTTIGYVVPTVELPDKTEVSSPAARAGLRAGDRILQIDGRRIRDWTGVRAMLMTGTGQTSEGQPRTVLRIERDGREMEVVVLPERAGEQKNRRIGIVPAEPLIVFRTAENSPARLAGLVKDDRITRANGTPVFSFSHLQSIIRENVGQPVALTIDRGGSTIETAVTPVVIPITTDGEKAPRLGADFFLPLRTINPTPAQQLGETLSLMQRVLTALFSPRSDIRIGDMSGLPGIVIAIYETSQADFRLVLWVTLVINVNFAILNLLPIPVLDGGHILFATLARLRGRPLPMRFIATAHGTFFVLLFGLMIYIGFKDVGREISRGREIDELQKRYIEERFPAPTP